MGVLKVLGAEPTGKRLQRIQQSAHYRDGAFHNLTPTELTLKNASYAKMTRDFVRRPANTAPPAQLPSVATDLRCVPDEVPSIVWFGHSSYLIRYKGTTIVVDPVLSGHASPLPFLVRSFAGTDTYGVHDIPAIDIMILTHDHYDHVDYSTIKQLAPRTALFCTSLGVGAHLEAWGVRPEAIREFDWWDEMELSASIGIAATPARHFSGRTFRRNQTLWSSFVLKLDNYTLFLGGDSGYDTHFTDISRKYGPFDIAILEMGQYGSNWPYIHTIPEETVQAAVDLRTRLLLPVHWAKFTLALHEWDEPAKRVIDAAHRQNMALTTPMIGEPVVLGVSHPQAQWWTAVHRAHPQAMGT